MKKFEYKTLEIDPEGKWIKRINIESSDLETHLNELGNDGWELVNSIDYAIEGYTQKILLFFKKEITVV